MHRLSFKGGLFISAAASLLLSAQAEEPAATPPRLDDFTVSAGPTYRAIEDFAPPLTTLDSQAIRRSAGSNLGELLAGQPGVHETGFGGGASRPIIRGFDGPRVRILDSGIEAADVSETSPDHGVALEPLLVQRIEILRGPATLLYGSSAIGGVVNVVGREIPRAPVGQDGYEGVFESSYETAAGTRKFLGHATVGNDHWALSFTGLTRDSRDYKIPGEAELEHDDDDDDEHSSGRLENSFVETDAYSVGGSWFFAPGSYIGASFSRYESTYGVPGHGHHDDGHGHGHGHHDDDDEEPVFIDMKRARFDLELMVAEPSDWIEAARLRFGYTDYEHTEFEDGDPETLFERDGWELRGEIAHRAIAFFDEGVIGVQLSDFDFSAKGDEAFTPPSTTRSQAVFTNQHIHGDRLHWDVGVRFERQTVDPKGLDEKYSDWASSLAGSAIWELDDRQSLALTLQRSQRHPSSTELYADGPHLATEQFEIGDPDLDLETAYGIDLVYRYRSGPWGGRVSAFYTHFDDYIFAEETGAEEEDLPVFEYTAVDARFWGFEAELDYTVLLSSRGQIRYSVVADYVRATNRDDREDLPRIPPFRLGGGIRWMNAGWDAGLNLRHSFRQSDTAPGESSTSGYTELSADLARTIQLSGKRELTFFARADNLLDEEIRLHTSFLKDVAPRPGRSFTLGARLAF